jgi:glycosyltransferase involved in cell wall biosynthesis
MKKIVQIVYSLESAGRAGLRLHNAFLKNNVSSHIISLQPGNSDSERIHILGRRPRLISNLDGKIQSFLTRKTLKQFGLFSFPVLGTNLAKIKEVKEADVIYLHWILGGFLNLSGIEKLVRLGKPIIIVLHDMWMITGGCHYSFSCEKYKKECFNCPVFPGSKKNDLANILFRKKRNFFSKYNNLFFVSPSKWLYDCAKSSMLLRDKPVFYIPNLIDSNFFKPFEKTIAKNILGLASKHKIIAFGAVSIDSPYKGWNYLEDSLELLSRDEKYDNISLLIFGNANQKDILKKIPFKTKFLGFLRDELSMVLAYNASDVFIVPSIADNQPTTVMESLCCGTPVVGFKTGGIPDMIIHKGNGYLAEYKNPADLANGIKFCLSEGIKGKALDGFNYNKLITMHFQIIEEALSKK